MADSPIKFGTSGWRGIIADEFTFSNVRLAVAAIAGHVLAKNPKPTVLLARDQRFFSEEFLRTAAIVLTEHGVHPLVCSGATPTPTVAFEVRRRKVDGAINFTASHNPAEYNGLKFSGPDGGPALPEVTKDIEARAAKLFAEAKQGGSAFPAFTDPNQFETIDAAPAYLARLGELVKFDVIKKASDTSKFGIVYDPLHGCGAGYLDRLLKEHGIPATTIRAERDVLFDGTGPDVSEENLAPLVAAMKAQKAHVGLASDGDADRFGIIDSTGEWISPNHILGLLYDYLLESRGWKLDAARSVPTSHLIDGVAKLRGFKVHQTPVGFKYIGQLILQGAIALGGEESAGLSIYGHLPEKDGILACLLVAEMVAARGTSIGDQIKDLFKRVGREYWPVRENFHLADDVKAATLERLKGNFTEFLGRRVTSTDRTDGLQLVFEDGAWILMRMSGTEPLMRVYAEAATAEESQKIADGAREWALSAAKGSTA
jgi:alpha-D-glucose phosphate-specific phosphoglucomutase